VATGVYPGSFNPPTVAHLAIAEAAVRQCGLDRVDLVLSRHALGKAAVGLAGLDRRLAVLEAIASTRPWLAVAVTDDQLVADIAAGYDVVVLGADKWAQVADPAWYGDDPARRDDAVAALPRLALAPRSGGAVPHLAPPTGTVHLDLPAHLHVVSATGVREGRREWLAEEARSHDLW
jgi:nicotinate-nucleotide adenylyltransferase